MKIVAPGGTSYTSGFITSETSSTSSTGTIAASLFLQRPHFIFHVDSTTRASQGQARLGVCVERLHDGVEESAALFDAGLV